MTVGTLKNTLIGVGGLAVAVAALSLVIDDYLAGAVLVPFLVYALAALGLNVLTGYCGQVSLGTGAFLGCGAYATFKLTTAFPDLNLIAVVLLSGGVTAIIGVVFGLPSLRIKGFYLAVATLAAQFFLVWLFNKVGWLTNFSPTGQITVPPRDVFGVQVMGAAAGPLARTLFCLGFVVVFATVVWNIARSRGGRAWMAVRDREVAAEIIGIHPLHAKLTAFAVSSFIIGMAGALYFGVWLGAAAPTEAFGIDQSFLVLFMIIIGGLGSVLGSFLGAAFMVLMPIVLKTALVDGMGWASGTAKHVEIMLLGVLIVFFLIKEPLGLAHWARLTKLRFLKRRGSA